MKTVNKDIEEVLKTFFEKFPLGLPDDVTMPPEDFLVLHLWLRGYKITPIFSPWADKCDAEVEE